MIMEDIKTPRKKINRKEQLECNGREEKNVSVWEEGYEWLKG